MTKKARREMTYKHLKINIFTGKRHRHSVEKSSILVGTSSIPIKTKLYSDDCCNWWRWNVETFKIFVDRVHCVQFSYSFFFFGQLNYLSFQCKMWVKNCGSFVQLKLFTWPVLFLSLPSSLLIPLCSSLSLSLSLSASLCLSLISF